MDALHAELWRKICDFQISGPNDSLTFTERLARENGWSIGFARRVVEEYRRFLFLAMVAGHEVTPSEQIDEAWHLHLVYTQSYWNELCRDVLGKSLHHHPTRGGPAEHSRHREQYNRTLTSYRAHFGEAAPADIWPAAEIRFGEDLHSVRVNRNRNWIIAKPRLWRRSRSVSQRLLLITGYAPLVVGVLNPFDLTGPEFLVFYGVLTAVVLAAAIALRSWLRTDELSDDVRSLEPQEVACLGRGAAGVLQTYLAGLVASGRIAIIELPAKKLGPIALGSATYKLRSTVESSSASTEIERVMLSAANSIEGIEAKEILTAAKPVASSIESSLQSRGLLETEERFGPARWWPLILLGSLAAIGIVKLVVGLARGKPIVILIIWLIALGVVAVLFARKPLRTACGNRLLDELKKKHKDTKLIAFADPNAFSIHDVMLVAGLFGVASVIHPQVQQLQSALKSVPPSDGGLAGLSGGCSGGCAGGGGCGGGGCGGGCGGCGGGD